MPEDIDKNINPQITKMQFGVRSLREVDIYPLSLGDELKFLNIVGESLQKWSKVSGEVDNKLIAFPLIADIIEKNIPLLIEFVTDDVKLEEVTNEQAIILAELIFDVNFGNLSKNARSLSEKMMLLFQPERQSPLSVNDIQDIDLNTSTKNDSEKEVSPEPK